MKYLISDKAVKMICVTAVILAILRPSYYIITNEAEKEETEDEDES